jgi:hypothetical protein
MRMRNSDGADTAARTGGRDCFFVEKRDAIPEQISTRGLQEQRALADSKLRFSADAEKLRPFIFETVVMIRP